MFCLLDCNLPNNTAVGWNADGNRTVWRERHRAGFAIDEFFCSIFFPLPDTEVVERVFGNVHGYVHIFIFEIADYKQQVIVFLA